MIKNYWWLGLFIYCVVSLADIFSAKLSPEVLAKNSPEENILITIFVILVIAVHELRALLSEKGDSSND